MKKIAKLGIFTVVLAACIVFVAWSIATFNDYRAAKIAQYEALGIDGGLVDLPGFFDFWYGQASMALGIAVVVAAILASFKKPKLR